MDRDDALQQAKAGYARAARKAGHTLATLGIVGETPPDRDRRIRHWAYSLTRVHDSLAIAELDVAWWTYRAVDVVEAWLSAHTRPIRVFEYGSGASTLWLSRRADEIISVEHHRGFAEHIAPILAAQGNIDLRIVEPAESASPDVPSRKEGHSGLDFTDYVAAIDSTEGSFDLVVIDGRAREACLPAALPRLAPDGIIVFDNSRRARYRVAIQAAGVRERRLPGLTPTLPYPEQTSVLTRTNR
ncbi:MAG: putative methyltransferase [Pseudonocardia sp.]|nr:putative methyltransferase [Pseudonocardia sp.]